MMKYSIDRTVSLIYFWLKANKLPKTCRSLEEEYGKEIKDLKGVNYSLRKILGVYEAMSVLLTSFVTPEQIPNKKENPTANNIIRRRKNSGSKDVENSTAIIAETQKATIEDGNTIHKPPVAKKKKEPAFLPGVWNCPEMENALNNVYERNRKSITTVAVGTSGHASPLLSPASPSLLSPNSTVEIDEVNLPLTTVANKKEDSVGDFTSDSDSDSDDDAASVKKAVELCNSIVSASPIRPLQAVKLAGELANRSKANLTVDKFVPNPNNETEKSMISGEEHVKKKKKKKKLLMPINSTIYEDPNVTEEIPVSHTKKKKKKHRVNIEVPEGSLLVETSPSVETGIKKKKKRKNIDVNVDKQPSLENSNPQTPEFVKEPKKKKSKVTTVENNVTDVIAPRKQKVNHSEAVDNDFILSNLGDSLKKRKKKKHIDVGS